MNPGILVALAKDRQNELLQSGRKEPKWLATILLRNWQTKS
jgi:hypothetical protein